MKLKQLKSELKELAKSIRNLKNQRIYYKFGYVPALLSERWDYRHKHIAYCLLRGRTLEQIEPKVNFGNEPSERSINKYVKEYSNEAICYRGRQIVKETATNTSSTCCGPISSGEPNVSMEEQNASNIKIESTNGLFKRMRNGVSRTFFPK